VAPPRSNLEECGLSHWKEWHNGDRAASTRQTNCLQFYCLANLLRAGDFRFVSAHSCIKVPTDFPVLRKNLCSRKLNENGANSRAFLRLSGRRQNRDCSRNCNCQSLQEPQTSTDFNDRHATGSISISYKPQTSTGFNSLWNLVRDQGVGGSNPLSPTILNQ